jgi:hypothetical protein
MVFRKHLRANGLLLLREMIQMYKPKNVPEAIAAKTGEFWSQTKRLPSEMIDIYYNRFHELLDELSEAEEPISMKSAMRHFIFTLGSEFAMIQNNYHIGNLPTEWHTQDWTTFLAYAGIIIIPSILNVSLVMMVVSLVKLIEQLIIRRSNNGFSILCEVSPCN